MPVPTACPDLSGGVPGLSFPGWGSRGAAAPPRGVISASSLWLQGPVGVARGSVPRQGVPVTSAASLTPGSPALLCCPLHWPLACLGVHSAGREPPRSWAQAPTQSWDPPPRWPWTLGATTEETRRRRETRSPTSCPQRPPKRPPSGEGASPLVPLSRLKLRQPGSQDLGLDWGCPGPKRVCGAVAPPGGPLSVLHLAGSGRVLGIDLLPEASAPYPPPVSRSTGHGRVLAPSSPGWRDQCRERGQKTWTLGGPRTWATQATRMLSGCGPGQGQAARGEGALGFTSTEPGVTGIHSPAPHYLLGSYP